MVLDEKTVKVLVEVGWTDVTMVFTAVLAVEVTVGVSALRLAKSLGRAARLARWRSRREIACFGSTGRITLLRFQWRPQGRGIRVGMKVAHGSGKDGLGGTVQEGVMVCVRMFWVCSHLTKVCQAVSVMVVVTSDGTMVM
jgi:hypothetical protein